MHCHACELMTESEIGDLPNIEKVTSSLKTHTLRVTGEFGDKSLEDLAQELTKAIQKHGYTLSAEKQETKRHLEDFAIAIPIALGFIAIFFLLQKLGIVNAVSTNKINYGTIFLVGIIASLSTCMAVVGGLLLSLSANYAKSGDTVKPQIMFHVGRMLGFFILGGLIGVIGKAFQLTPIMSFGIGILIAIVMLILGVNLLDVFPWAKRFQFSTPKVLSQKAMGTTRITHGVAPLLIGIATFFLPCGFTQSMQVYTLSTGSFVGGALTMGIFALGTLPVLALTSFASLSIQHGQKSRIFFRTAGIIVILFAIFNVINSLAVIGIIPPLFNF